LRPHLAVGLPLSWAMYYSISLGTTRLASLSSKRSVSRIYVHFLAEHADEEERSLGIFLMEELYSFVGKGWEQEDDIILLMLRRPAPLS
jgi:hypothetical protein